jgi:hypothetical protein
MWELGGNTGSEADSIIRCYDRIDNPDSIGDNIVFEPRFSQPPPTSTVNPSTVRVLTSDYLANGGGKMEFFNGKDQVKVGIKLRDAIINYCLSQGTITSTLDNRIIYSNIRIHGILKMLDEE